MPFLEISNEFEHFEEYNVQSIYKKPAGCLGTCVCVVKQKVNLWLCPSPPPFHLIVETMVDTMVDTMVNMMVNMMVDSMVDTMVCTVVDTVVDIVVDTVFDIVVDTMVDT